ncbi:MAG: Dam family site-specific DNA-(adenine-N6)-methyltransferase [Caldilineaceae bacterium]
MKPFLKWAGGKQRLTPRILSLLPAGERLIEPFVGSAALFLASGHRLALLGDTNRDLIAVYQALQQEGEAFVEACRSLFTPEANTRECYESRRAAFNRSRESGERARLFVYLNKHCYNGLCRMNRRGEFNVPFGRYVRPGFPEAEMLAFLRRLQRCDAVQFVHEPFEQVMQQAGVGDVVYCDPPYVPLSATAHFTAYGAAPFGAAEQSELANQAESLARRGVPVLISNHDTPETRRLYAAATRLEAFSVRRHISCAGATRGHADELLALYA